MAFRKKIMVVLSLGVTVIILQMLAINILSSSQISQQLPWKKDQPSKWTAMPSLEHVGTMYHVTSINIPILQYIAS